MPNASFVPFRTTLLSQTSEHALRAALFLGRSGATLVAAADIAAALGTPPNYTGKILRRLAHKGLLKSVRGPRGGFALRVTPGSLTVSQILWAVDEPTRAPTTCLLGNRPCDGAHPCGAHGRWSEIEGRVAALLNETTIEDLLGADP